MASAGLDRVRKKLQTHARAAIEAGRTASRKQGDIIAGLAEAFVPEDQGALKRSIKVHDAESITTHGGEVGFVGVVVQAGDENTVVTNKSGGRFQNARIQEFGTQSRPANPFFYPAWRIRRRAARAAIGRAVRKAWKDQG